MDAERWRKIEELCHAVLECEPSDRPAFLHQVCAGDEELRRHVEALLAREKQAENFLQPCADGVAGSPALKIAAKAWAQDLTTATGPAGEPEAPGGANGLALPGAGETRRRRHGGSVQSRRHPPWPLCGLEVSH